MQRGKKHKVPQRANWTGAGHIPEDLGGVPEKTPTFDDSLGGLPRLST